MIEGIIALILLFVGIVACIIWSANTAIKWQRIFTEIFACLGVLALCTIIGCTAPLPERDTADGETYKTPLEVVQNDEAIVPTEQQLENANRKIEIAKAEAEAKRVAAEGEAEANRILAESITPDILLKMLIEKWNGELPTDVSIGKVEDDGADT